MCHKWCSGCTGSTANDCSSCNAAIANIVKKDDGSCGCKDNHYLKENECKRSYLMKYLLACHALCDGCTEEGTDKCTKCKATEGIISTSGCSCNEEGYFLNPINLETPCESMLKSVLIL